MRDGHPELTAIGRYRGHIAPAYRDPAFLAALEQIDAMVAGPQSEIIASGRNRNVKICFPRGESPLAVAVKQFRPQPLILDLAGRFRGSKAARTWLVAESLHGRGIGTPRPIGFLELRRNGRLAECYFLAEYQEGITTFVHELIRLFCEDPDCSKFMALLRCVAGEVRRMHEAGINHRDLGNQNILLRRKGENEWGDVMFTDLNRGRVKPRLSACARARDVSRLYLGAELLRIFMEMYWQAAPPSAFLACEKLHRRLYAVHCATRAIRHPLRRLRRAKENHSAPTYPDRRDMWIWDDKSAQAISVHSRRSRLRLYPATRHWKIAGSTLMALPGVWREYGRLMKTAYAAPVSMENRIGVAVSPTPETLDRELALLAGLGKVPAFVRFYCHETDRQREFAAEVVRQLRARGHPVSIALAQDRKAVSDTARWESFVSGTLDRVHSMVEWVEVGHAINRVKWGVWSLREYGRMLETVARAGARYPDLKFIGPAVMDFDCPFLIAALKSAPHDLRFAAVSNHLYVDRRGAPENRQGPFSALEKFALARAAGRRSGVCGDRLIVSEVNWPLKGAGVWSPVGSPYESPGPRRGDPSVTEDKYADYMIRYLAVALCSGMADRVFWWRLVARGFGLADDAEPSNWRERPAYRALKCFLALLGPATFVTKLPSGPGVGLFMFRRPDNGTVCLAYSAGTPREIELPFRTAKVRELTGNERAGGHGRSRIMLSDRPLYLFPES